MNKTLEKPLVDKTKQKQLNVNRDNNMSITSRNDITGLFKTTSHLSRSIKERNTQERTTNNNYYSPLPDIITGQANTKFDKTFNITMAGTAQTAGGSTTIKKTSLSSSGKMVMTKPPSLKETTIKNLTHNYLNIDNQDAVYEMFRVLKEDKRANHLDTLDSFDVWKENYFNQIDDRSNRQFENLKKSLHSTKSHMNNQFNLSEIILVDYIYRDIDKVEESYNEVFEKRKTEIELTRKQINNIEKERNRVSENYIANLKKDLNDIGFILVGEVDDFIEKKNVALKEYVLKKKESNIQLFKFMEESEKELYEEAKRNFNSFVIRWKGIRLNKFIEDTKKVLNSEEFVDNKERYELVDKLKGDQVVIYNERIKHIEKLTGLGLEELSCKKVEAFFSMLEDINNKADNLYDMHTKNLSVFSEKIDNNCKKEIEIFKEKVATIRYQFETENGLEELINAELIPIVEKCRQERIQYSVEIVKFIDDFDEYVQNCCARILRIFKEIGKKNDDHKKNLETKEKQYSIELAKEADSNDEILSEKEDKLQIILNEMKSGIDKSEIDEKLAEGFLIIDELGVEYRDYFARVDALLSSHEGNLIDQFHTWESYILYIFSIVSKDQKEDILLKRQTEAEFLSYLKEQEILEQEAREQPQLDAKGKPIKKKEAPKPKKGEAALMLVPPKPIADFKSPIGFDYIVDINYDEIGNYIIRDVIQKVDLNEDNIISNVVKFVSPLPARPDSKSKDPKVKKAATDEPKEDLSLERLQEINPYKVLSPKQFTSPVSMKQTKALYENCLFNAEYISNILKNVTETSLDRVNDNLKNIIEHSKITDNDRREEFLSELDIRLKSLAPRKGKIEVEDYDKRIGEIEKHNEKYIKHTKDILQRNETDEKENQKLLDDLKVEYDELNSLFLKLAKGMDEETINKNLDDKFKKFKTSYYTFNLKLEEAEIKLDVYGKKNPENLISLNKNFILTLQTFEKGGTYSEREKEFYEYQINQINEETILNQQVRREKQNKEILAKYKTIMTQELEKFEKKYKIMNEYIMAKDGVGKKFGTAKRLVHDLVINVRMKCNQAKEGLDALVNKLIAITQDNKCQSKNLDYLTSFNYVSEVKKIILAINNCVYYYGKYINGFRDGFTYNLVRITLRENTEALELSGKDELEEDENRKKEEQQNLGLLSRFITGPSLTTYDQELNGIDEKVRNECAKVYTGEFLKLINTPEKILPVLLPFIKETKLEMEKNRLVYIRDLRSFCGKFFNYVENLPLEIYRYIYDYHQCSYNDKQSKIFKEYDKALKASNSQKDSLNQIIGPNLANPYYKDELNKIINEEKERSRAILSATNEKQYESIEAVETIGASFYLRCAVNFEAFLTLFDSLFLEEDFIILEDDDIVFERKDYNFLTKLKPDFKPNLNLNNKRTYKKIYLGINKNLLKINYYEKFKEAATKFVENNEDKVKALQDSGKENLTKNITALKTPCNKQLFLRRNEFYENYSNEFKIGVDSLLKYFDKIREEEIMYKTRWDEIIESLEKLKI